MQGTARAEIGDILVLRYAFFQHCHRHRFIHHAQASTADGVKQHEIIISVAPGAPLRQKSAATICWRACSGKLRPIAAHLLAQQVTACNIVISIEARCSDGSVESAKNIRDFKTVCCAQ